MHANALRPADWSDFSRGPASLAVMALPLGAPPPEPGGAAESATEADVAAARVILDGWQADEPEPGARILLLIAGCTNDRALPTVPQLRPTPLEVI